MAQNNMKSYKSFVLAYIWPWLSFVLAYLVHASGSSILYAVLMTYVTIMTAIMAVMLSMVITKMNSKSVEQMVLNKYRYFRIAYVVFSIVVTLKYLISIDYLYMACAVFLADLGRMNVILKGEFLRRGIIS